MRASSSMGWWGGGGLECFADGIDGLALGLVVGAGVEFGVEAHDEELDGEAEEHEGRDDPEGALDEQGRGEAAAEPGVAAAEGAEPLGADDGEHGGAGEEAKPADFPEEVHGLVAVFEHEAHGDAVEDDAGDFGEAEEGAVFGGAVFARVVADGHLDDFCADPFGVGDDEAVHFAVEVEALDDFAAVGLEGAAVVVDREFQVGLDEVVEDLGGEGPDTGVLAVLAPAADDVGVFAFEEVEHCGDVGGVVLEVAVHGDDDAAAGEVEAGGEGGGLAEVAAKADEADLREARGCGAEGVPGAVGGAVIDEDGLGGAAEGGEGGVDGLAERGDGLDLVVEGDSDGDVYGGCWHGDGRGCTMHYALCVVHCAFVMAWVMAPPKRTICQPP